MVVSDDVRPADVQGGGEASRLAAELRDALSEVVATDRAAIGRLRYARTSVRFSVLCERSGTAGVLLRLDRERPEVAAAGSDGPAEIQIGLTPEQARHFVAGGLHLPTALERDAVQTSGPLRKYLEIDPILRGALADRAGRDARPGDPGAAPGAERRTLPPELLAIETRDLHKSFGRRSILRGVNLAVPEGVISIVLGPSGTGKSVLLNHVIGLMRPERGDVAVRGRSLRHMSRSELLGLRLEVGVMFQDGALFSAMNVYDNVAFPLRQHAPFGAVDRTAQLRQHVVVGPLPGRHAVGERVA